MNKKNNRQKKEIFPAIIVKILNENRIAINRGSIHHIKLNQRFLVYSLSDEIIQDPETKENLGYLEMTKGIGKVIHVQEKMAIIESDQKSPSTRKTYRSPFGILYPGEEITEFPGDIKPFDNPEIGDKVKPI